MGRFRYILGLCLTAVYLLSMAHTLFHAQMHQFIAPVCEHHCTDSGCSGHHDHHDHDHNNACAECCNIDLQFIPTDSAESQSPDVLSTDIIAALCTIICDSEQPRELYRPPCPTSLSLYCSFESSSRPLRAPPIS